MGGDRLAHVLRREIGLFRRQFLNSGSPVTDQRAMVAAHQAQQGVDLGAARRLLQNSRTTGSTPLARRKL